MKNSNFKRENNHALLCQKYKAWIIWRNWQAWVTGANLDSYRCREWRLQPSTVHRGSCVTSCFLKSAHLFSLCDNPSIVMLLYALNMTRFSGLLSCLCCSFCLLAERTSELLPQIQLVLHTSYQAAETWMNHGHWPSAFCAFQMHFNMFAKIFSSCSPCLKVIITLE